MSMPASSSTGNTSVVAGISFSAQQILAAYGRLQDLQLHFGKWRHWMWSLCTQMISRSLVGYQQAQVLPNIMQGLQILPFIPQFFRGHAEKEGDVRMQVDTDLISINQKLRDYQAAWDSHVDAWLVVKVGSPEWVQRWRLQAEHAMRDSGKPGMSDKQVVSYTSVMYVATFGLYHEYLSAPERLA